MDTRPIVDNGAPPVTPPTDSVPQAWTGTEPGAEGAPSGEVRFAGDDGDKSLAAMAQRDLVGTLQLLVERARYITAATGAAIALRDHGEMTCRASAGSSAPEVGAHLQIDSGLSGESVRTRKTLRCDDAATDPRVNRESCDALGIASVVVMPLVRGNHVIGVFELFSDQPNVFQNRDIRALERMGAMVFTAMEQALVAMQARADMEATTNSVAAEEPVEPAEHRPGGFRAASTDAPSTEPPIADVAEPGASSSATIESMVASAPAEHPSFSLPRQGPATAPLTGGTRPDCDRGEHIVEFAHDRSAGTSESPASLQEEVLGTRNATVSQGAPLIPEAVPTGPREGRAEGDEQDPGTVARKVSNRRRCQGCGFPVSEWRQFCLDCERKAAVEPQNPAKNAARSGEPLASDSTRSSAVPAVFETGPMPAFLHAEPHNTSWLVTHKYTVGAIVVALAGFLVFVFAR